MSPLSVKKVYRGLYSQGIRQIFETERRCGVRRVLRRAHPGVAGAHHTAGNHTQGAELPLIDMVDPLPTRQNLTRWRGLWTV